MSLSISKLSVALLHAGKTSKSNHILSERPLGPIGHIATLSIRLENTRSAFQTISARPLHDGTRDQRALRLLLLLRGLPGAEGREAREETRPGNRGGRRGRCTRSHRKGPPASFCVLGENEGWVCRARVLLCNGQPALLGVTGPRCARPKGRREGGEAGHCFPWRRGHVRTVWISRLGRELELVVFTNLISLGVHDCCVVVVCWRK